MKKAAKKLVARILWSQVRRLKKKNNFKIVAVAGSVGKTSTKLAIAKTLQAKYRVQYQDGNYNDLVSVPLIFFGQPMPSLYNPIAWLRVFLKNEGLLRQKYEYDVVVVELGTDGPGQLSSFVPYLKADVGVLTSIAPEHMEYFKTMEAVAAEELTISKLSDQFLFNSDLVDSKYINNISGKGYGINQLGYLRLENLKFNNGYSFDIKLNGQQLAGASKDVVSFPQLYSIAAASLVGNELGMTAEEIVSGIEKITPVSGRMQKIAGLNGSVIIDDTYNASPQAVIAALDTLYRLDAPHKIAVLGNMNELGDYSKEAHTEVGKYCDPKKVSLVLTLGPDANNYLAAAAEGNGCKVMRFEDPYSLGEYLKTILKENYLVLFKGSQNKVFAEEAVKIVLADPNDSSKLVRQSESWLKTKQANFGVK